MRKTIIILLLLAFSIGVLPASATPASELSALARIVPDDTQVFIGFRTDDNFITEMDTLAALLPGSMPGMIIGQLNRMSDSLMRRALEAQQQEAQATAQAPIIAEMTAAADALATAQSQSQPAPSSSAEGGEKSMAERIQATRMAEQSQSPAATPAPAEPAQPMTQAEIIAATRTALEGGQEAEQAAEPESMPAEQSEAVTNAQATADAIIATATAIASEPLDMPDAPAATFADVYRTWLGDTGAFVIRDFETLASGTSSTDEPVMLALSVTDQAEAENFLDIVTGPGSVFAEYSKATDAGSIIYTPDTDYDPSYVLMDGVMLVGSVPDLNLEASLADSEQFQSTLAGLPGDDYNLLAYIDTPAVIAPFIDMIVQEAITSTQSNPMTDNMVEALQSSSGQIGPQAIGLTIMNERALIVDFSHTMILEDGASIDVGAPIDPAFAGQLPADTALLIHNTGLGPSILRSLDAIQALGDELDAEVDGTPLDELVPEQIAPLLVDDSVTFFRLAFKGLMGMPIDEGLSWLDEDYAIFVRLLADETTGPSIDSGLLARTADSDAASAFIGSLPDLFHELDITYSEEDGQIVLPFLRQAMVDQGLPDNPDQDFVITAADGLFAAGTRPAVDFAMTGGDSLATNTTYQAASAHFLPDTQTLWYIGAESIKAFLADSGLDAELSRDEAETINLIESASITASYEPNGRGVARMVLTLASAD